jgi:hypothetical protein
MSIGLDRRIRQDLLNRLRWNVLGGLNNIEIACDTNKLTTYLPFFDHPAADESLGDEAPLSHIGAFSQDLATKEDMDLRLPEEYRYKPPADLTISNEDGRPITLRQFVTEVHAYLNLPDVMGDIKKMKAAFLGHPVTREDGSQGRNTIYGHPVKLPEEVQFFFTSTMIFERDGTVTFRLSLFLEGELSQSAEEFWTGRQRRAREYEMERQA